MKKVAILAVFFVALGLYLPCVIAESVQSLPQPTGYVNDYAHVLSPEATARLESLCDQLDHSDAKAQIAVVTIHTLDGQDAAEYANALEEKWKMGSKGSDRGALVLLAVDDHKYRIDVAYGLEGILPDGKVGDIGRSMIPDLRTGDYDSAVTLAVGQVAKVIADDAKVTLEDESMQRPVDSHPVPARAILIILALLFYGGFTILRMLLSFGIFGRRWRHVPWLGTGGPWIIGGGGSGDGGSSSDGGFGGFGGGSFGGGGAGGSW